MSKFFESLEQDVKRAEKELQEFSVSFKANPIHALTWSVNVFKASVIFNSGKEVLKCHRSISSDELKDYFVKRCVSLASSATSRSTSHCSNLIADCEVEFWAGLVDKLAWNPHTPEAEAK